MRRMNNNTANPPQSGIVTQNHDQSITLHSFRTINATPRSPKKLIPELEELDFDIVIVFSY